MSGHKNVLDDLKNKISQQIRATPTSAAAAARETPDRDAALRKPQTQGKRRTAKSTGTEPLPRSGRGVQFYLEDSDRTMIRRLALWFGSQDRRVSDSQVIKTAIRMADAHQGAKLLDLCDEVLATDRRRTRN